MRRIFLFLLAILMIPAVCFAVPGYPQKSGVINKELTSANTEYQLVLPDGTGGFTMQSRTASDFKWGNASTSGTTYYTVKSGTVYSTPTTLNIGVTTPNTTLFLQTASGGQIIEVVYWK